MKRKSFISVLILAFIVMTVSWSLGKEPEVGRTYTAKDVAEIKEYLPPTIYHMMASGELGDDGQIRVDPTENYIAKGLNKFWYEATEANKGKAKIGPKGELVNWVSGFPFGMEPKSGAEIAWNIDLHYRGDDRINDWELPVFLKTKIEKVNMAVCKFLYMSSKWGNGRRFFCGDIPNPQDIQEYYYVGLYAPEEVNGLQTLEIRYYAPDKPDDMWAYVPSMRRIRRMSTAQRMDQWAGTDSTYDDFDGWHGKSPDWNINIVGKKKMLIPRNLTEEATPAGRTKIPWTFIPLPMQFMDVYVVEFIPKDPNHIYSKGVGLIDPEVFEVPVRENYDKRGNLWKFHGGRFEFKTKRFECDGKDYFTYFQTGAYHVDIQRTHGLCAIAPAKLNFGMTESDFTVEAMRKWAR
ncbi:MAG: DUF1329 domain-containing protein [Pseudomonadota bacterium]